MEDKEKIELQEGLKPVPGIPSNFGQGTTVRQLDDQGKVIDVRSSGAPLDTRNVKTKEEYENPVRVGDYYYAPNRTLQVWENSPTDILQKSRVAVGGTEAPVDTVSLKNEGLGTLGGAVIGSIAGPAGALVGALAGGLVAHNTAAEEALKQWQEQDVKYDSAVEFYKDDDGTIKYQFDYDKMGTGGPRSGEAVKEAQTRETEVRLGDDGRLKVKVSPIFASTERFQEMMNYISENYGGLSKDTENLDEVLTEIKNGIDGEVKSYVSNMKLYADFAHRFPNASPETVVASYTTEVSGYVKPDGMKDYQVSVLEGDEITTKSAKDFFDSVLKMDKGKRNELAKKLNDIVYGEAEGYDDNKRAIAYGELQAMFAASANTEEYENDKYQGMMDADPFVSWLNNFAPLGLNGADVVSFLSGGNFSKQEYLNQNDFAEFLGGAMGIGAGFGFWKGGTKLVEGALKRLPGSAQLFNASVSGMGREGLAAAIAAGRTGDVTKMWAAELGFKTLKIGTFDAALAGAQTAVSDKDFWTEFGQDFARDAVLEAVFSYYDMIQFQKYVTDTNVYVYRDVKTGNLKKEDTYRGNTFTAYEMSDDGLLTETSYEQVAKVNVVPTGEGKGASVIQTPQGTTVEIVNGKIRYTPGKAGVVEGTVVEETAAEFQSLSTGVVNTRPTDETDILREALERDGQSADIEAFQMPSQQADAAIVAGKIAKAQGTKFGGELYKQLFNKNGYLDMANNLALAKDGDLNAWRNAQEQFVSVAQNAQNNLQDIQNGVYIKNAAQEWQNTLQVIGGFNYEFKYKPKTDGAYINAINQIQRAQLLNDSRPEGDTTDYVAKALEKYGDTISRMPQERAEALQAWLEQGKKWLKVFNQSVRKSGKVDVKLLDSYTDTDIEAKIGYFPVWAKRTTYKGLLDNFYGLSQERNPYKDWLRNGEWVPLDELEDPYTAMTRYMGFMANNMGLNDRNETAAKVLERADLLVDNTPTDATIRKRKLDSIKNKDELIKKLDEMVEAKKKEVKEKTLTPKQYADAMTKLYEDSAIEETAEALATEVPGTEKNAQEFSAASEKSMQGANGRYPYGQFPDYSIKPKKGYGILYTNTPNDKVDIINKEGLKIGQNLEAYGPSPDEGMYIWTDSRNPKESSYGGNTVAFQVPLDEIKQGTVNDTQVIIPHGIPREDILFIDKIYNYTPVIKASNLKEYVDKYGVEKTLEILGRNDWVNLDEVRDIIGLGNGSEQGYSSELNVFDEIPSTIEQKNMLDTSPESAPSSKYANLKDYYAKEKGMEADFVYMTPDEYLEALLEKNGGVSSYQTIDDIVKRSRETTPNRKGWGDYAEDMRAGNFNPELSEGGKFPPPYLAYRASGVEQEGIHRALAARSLGITKMPVVVETPVKNKPAAAKKLLEGKARVKYPQPTSEEQWGEFWNNAPAQTRKDIRNELEKTSLQTGYGIKDTRARLNAQVPGFDVLEWSLLGRDHTNGLVPTEPQFRQPRIPTYEDYQKGLQADPNMVNRIQDSYRGALAQKLIREATRVVGLAEDYLSAYSWGSDWQSYLNTSLIPDLKDAINQRMLPEEFKNFVQARMVQAIQDVAPYQSPELIMKSQLDNVAQEWREWAEKHIKAGRFTQKDLKEFVGSHNLELPNDKRSYPSKVKHALWQIVEDGGSLPKVEGLSSSKVSRNMDKTEFYEMLDNTPLFQSAVKDKKELVDLVAAEKNGETIDGYTMGVSAAALGLGGRYPLPWYKNGKPYTRFIKYDTPEKQRWAEEFVSILNDKELVREEGLISRFFSGAANDFRLLTTGWDPSRVYSNITRDTTRSFSIGKRFISTKNTLQSAIEMGNYTPKQKEILSKAIENAAKNAASASYNSAYRSPKRKQISITKEYLSQTGANPMKRFMYNLVHDKRSIAEGPMEFFEGWSRRNNARSLAAVQLGKDQVAGLSFKKQLQNAVDAANFAGREYTANFQRKGKLIGRVSKYVAYQSSAYAGLDGMMRAFIDDPKTVTRNFAVFVIAYMILLADTLSREETRKQYYRLSEYDRENQIVIGMGDSILTIPMDQELAGLLYPYRAILETLEGTDQPSFFQFVWGTFTEWMPMDLSGFSEGDGFNLARGLEKLTAQNMPTGLTPIQEAATGYDLYYGNDISVSDETLKDYGIYDPQAGDYTTNSKDSLFLRNVANLTGIPQWQLQAMWEGYGGNVGKYVLNIIDKAAGATKEQQGGKDFADAVFGSMTALDQDAASSAFYDGLSQLKKEKNSLLQKMANYNEDLKVASGQAKVELQNKIQKAKEEYGVKVGDFVDKYVSAYDITGGLPKNQAQQIYYLFRLDDDDTIYESGSTEEYYQKQAQQKFKNQATALSAPILDKYYNNRIGNIYQDADGVWRRYLSGGAQAMRNSIYGHGEQQMVDLLNILEGKDSNLTDYRKRIKDARSKAYDAKDWDTRDALGYELDKKVIEVISPYIERYGAENVLGNTQVLDYLSEWFIVPDDFIRTKKGKNVSLGNNASTQEAFVRPFIKYVFGLPTNFSSYRDAKYNSLEIGK